MPAGRVSASACAVAFSVRGRHAPPDRQRGGTVGVAGAARVQVKWCPKRFVGDSVEKSILPTTGAVHCELLALLTGALSAGPEAITICRQLRRARYRALIKHDRALLAVMLRSIDESLMTRETCSQQQQQQHGPIHVQTRLGRVRPCQCCAARHNSCQRRCRRVFCSRAYLPTYLAS